jgi:hypothetical protein
MVNISERSQPQTDSDPILVEAHIAQMVEHSLGKGEVTGSIPVVGTTISILVII